MAPITYISTFEAARMMAGRRANHWDRFLIPGAINNECVGFSIIEIEKLCKESTECKAEQAYVRNQKPVPVIPSEGLEKIA